jgi:transposase
LQDPEEYQRKVEQLHQLLLLADDNFIELVFADESGFNLNPNVPYAWQPPGEYQKIVPRRGKTLNCFGFMTKDNKLDVFSKEGAIDAQFVVDSMDTFAARLLQPTVVVVDNARIHTCKKFMEKLPQWEEQGLYIFHLPKYSPHLNLIETLWRKIKHEWLEVADYDSWESLTGALDRIFAGFGTAYTIDFNEQICVE